MGNTTKQRILDQLRERLEVAPDDGWVSTKTLMGWFWSKDRHIVRAVLDRLVEAGEVEKRPCVYRGNPGVQYRLVVQDLSEELAALGLAWSAGGAAAAA